MPGFVLGSKDVAVSKIDKDPCPPVFIELTF